MGQQTHWKLTVRDESQPAYAVMLAPGEKIIVGRSRTCEIILSDLSVSRKHCLFSVGDEGALKLVDFGARHPTLLNGIPLEEGCAVLVRDGGQVRLGRSFVEVECLRDIRAGRTDPEVDEELEHTRTAGVEKSGHTEVVERDPANDLERGAETRCSDHKDSNDRAAALQSDFGQEFDDDNSMSGIFDKTNMLNISQQSTDEPANASGQEEKTRIVESTATKQVQPDQLVPPRKGEDESDSKNEVSVGDDGDLDIKEATKPSHVNAPEKPDGERVNKSVPQEKARHDHAAVLGKTLQGKVVDPKVRKSDPVLNNAASNESDDGRTGVGDEAVVNDQSDAALQDETSFVDPKELQHLMNGKKGSPAKKAGVAKGPRQTGDDAANTSMNESDPQDETNFVDPVELQKLMKGKQRAAGKGRNKKGPAASSKKEVADGKADLKDSASQDETGYVDPAELQRLMKGKGGLFGKKGRKSNSASTGPAINSDDTDETSPDNGAQQDETGYIDPSELQKLTKGKAGLFGKRGGKKKPATKGPAGENADPVEDAPLDETNFVDPAELRKLMKGKAGPFGSKGKKKGSPPAGPSGNGGGVNQSDADGPLDETNFVDPEELRKLMKKKAAPSRSNKGKQR